MKTIDLRTTVHEFEKENLVTKKDGSDTLKCKCCGIRVRRSGLGDIVTIIGRPKVGLVKNCNKAEEDFQKNIGRTVKITNCSASGSQWANCTSGSTHIVIDAPKGESNSASGVWIQGEGEPVTILNEEFAFVEAEKEVVEPKKETLKEKRAKRKLEEEKVKEVDVEPSVDDKKTIKKPKKEGVLTKQVEQIDLESKEVIATWDSVRLAGEGIGKSSAGIRNCCRNANKSAHGSGWRYKEVTK